MKTIRLMMLLVAVLLLASTALAQYTLYGSPEVVQLPPVQPNRWAQTYPTTQPGPMVTPASPAYGAASVPVQQPRLAQPSGNVLQTAPGAMAGERPSVIASMINPDACNSYEPSCGDSCAPDACAAPCCPCSPWFASAAFLTMGRDKANHVWTTYDSDHQAWQLTNTGDIEMDWGYGGEIRFGRRFCGCGCTCQPWGLEVVYWSMQPVHGFLSTTAPGGSGHVSTPLDFAYTQFAGVGSGTDYFDDAEEHRLWRRNEFHNVEINLLRGGFMDPCMRSWNVQWAVGVRYFRFDEDLKFGSLERNSTWGEDGGTHEAYLDDRIKNNLVGFQLGFDARSGCWHGLQLYVAPKVGIYNNYIENTYSLYRGDGVNAVSLDEDRQPDGNYPVRSHDNVFSVLTEVDLGLYWHVTQNWSARIGYRLVAISGIGLADDQYIHYVNDIPEINNVKHNGDLFLHGAFAGVTYNY